LGISTGGVRKPVLPFFNSIVIRTYDYCATASFYWDVFAITEALPVACWTHCITMLSALSDIPESAQIENYQYLEIYTTILMDMVRP
jgi:hypothetical protein